MADESDAIHEAINKAMVAGPSDITLGNQAVLKLPSGFAFVPEKESQQWLKKTGNGEEKGLLGLIFPMNDEDSWFAVVTFEDSGYIKDDDAKSWDAEELLESIKEGTSQLNEERKNLGLTELEIIGWVERPHYEVATHQLKWSVSSKHKGSTDESSAGINYNTYVLGREGYLNLNFVTGLADIERQKPIAQNLLNALAFNQGKTYGDFDSNTDKIAAYGLTALVAGVAAKKLGLIAIALAFFAKFAKFIIVGVVAVIAIVRKFFKRSTPEAS